MTSVRLIRSTCAAELMCRFSHIQRRTTPGWPSGKRTTTRGWPLNRIVSWTRGISARDSCSSLSLKSHLPKGYVLCEPPCSLPWSMARPLYCNDRHFVGGHRACFCHHTCFASTTKHPLQLCAISAASDRKSSRAMITCLSQQYFTSLHG